MILAAPPRALLLVSIASLIAIPTSADRPHNGSEFAASSSTLRQVLIIHRHGDRSPTEFGPTDKLANESFWYFNGIGQLTNEGKARLYRLGKYMRGRYDAFLGDSVNKNQRITRSSGVLRCIESAQMFLAGLLSLDTPDARDASDLKWDNRSNELAQLWQPVNIQSVPKQINGMLSESNCAEIDNIYHRESTSRNFKDGIGARYGAEIRVLEEVWGSSYHDAYNFSNAISTLKIEKTYFGDKLDERLLKIYDRVQAAGYEVYGQLADTRELQRLLSGLLVDDMIKSMQGFRAEYSNKTKPYKPLTARFKKFVHYSSHDTNIVGLLQTLDQYQQTTDTPGFGANYVIELHQDGVDWFLRFFYMQTALSELKELRLDRCADKRADNRCLLDTFTELLDGQRITNWLQWVRECKNDLSSIDIFSQI